MRSAIDAEMRKFSEAADFNGVAFDTKVTIGRAADAICDYAQKENIDMIITPRTADRLDACVDRECCEHVAICALPGAGRSRQHQEWWTRDLTRAVPRPQV